MVNIRTKGASGERELKTLFADVMRSVEQRLWLPGNSDKVKRNSTQSDRGGDDLVGIPLLSIEVKRQETLSINTWFKQCEKSARAQSLMPVLIYRQSRKPWRVVTYVLMSHPKYETAKWVRADIDLDDFMCWYEDIYAQWLTRKATA